MPFPWKYSRDSVLENNKRIFDTHCHLNSPELIEHAEMHIFSGVKEGVNKFLVAGYDYNSSLSAIKLAEAYDTCYAAIGFQPEELEGVSEREIDELFYQNINNPKIVAVGEIGLDYHWEKDKQKQKHQQDIFIKQIQIANQYKLPVLIHCRDAAEDCLQILKKYTPIYGGVMHCYSSSVELMKEFIKLGMYISLGGPVTFSNAKTPKEVAIAVPLDKLVVETDAPYLAPNPLRGSLNVPGNIKYIVEEIARLRKVSKEEICVATYTNACRLFNIKDEKKN